MMKTVVTANGSNETDGRVELCGPVEFAPTTLGVEIRYPTCAVPVMS